MVARRPRAFAPVTLAAIRIAVACGMADVVAGRTVDAAEAFAELEAYFQDLARGDDPDGASIQLEDFA